MRCIQDVVRDHRRRMAMEFGDAYDYARKQIEIAQRQLGAGGGTPPLP